MSMRTLILTSPPASRMLSTLAAAVPAPLVVTDRERAWSELHARPYDLLILLDVPWRQVRSMLLRLRQSRTFALPDPWIPVLVIGGGTSEAERVQLLDAGADACLAGGCEEPAVGATLRALWRRRSHARPVVVPHELVVNRVSRVVLREGAAIALTPPEFSVLQCLMDLRPATATARELREQLGERHDIRSMQSVIFQLRTKLGRNAIRTVRGSGYRLAADARWSEPPVESVPLALMPGADAGPPLVPVAAAPALQPLQA